jgi:hypothetical protein
MALASPGEERIVHRGVRQSQGILPSETFVALLRLQVYALKNSGGGSDALHAAWQ